MIAQLAIGTVVIVLTVAIHAEMFALLWRHFDWLTALVRPRLRRFANTGLVMIAMLYVMLVIALDVWLWAGVLVATGAVAGIEPAVYFALVCFTTLGFGDIVLAQEWRLLSALIAANGFLMLGWSAAYMVELVRRTS